MANGNIAVYDQDIADVLDLTIHEIPQINKGV